MVLIVMLQFLMMIPFFVNNSLCMSSEDQKIKDFEQGLAERREYSLNQCFQNADVLIICHKDLNQEITFNNFFHDEVCIVIKKLLKDTVSDPSEKTTFGLLTIHCKKHGTCLTREGSRAWHIWQSLQKYKNSKN